MKTKFLALLIIIIFALFGIFIFFPEQNICSQIEDNNIRYYCLAITRGDKTLCSHINSSRTRGSCYFYLALKLEDKSICEELPIEQPDKNFTFFYTPEYCLYRFALRTKDPNLCPYDRHDMCYEELAFESWNVSLCNFIQDKNHSTYCRAIITVMPSICKEIPNNSKYYFNCYGELANLTRNATLCEIAFYTSDLERLYITHLYTCYDHGSFCELLPSEWENIVLRDECLARRDKNVSLCSDSLCVESIAERTNNKSLCETLDSHMKNLCLSELARTNCDTSLCFKLPTQKEKDECIYDLLANLCFI